MTDSIGATALDALLSPEGQRLLAELAENPPTSDREIALITTLRKRYAAALVSAAIEQTSLRIRARAKFSKADAMYFTRAGLEQASSERMAAHHAERYAGLDCIADLCTGIGGDLIGLARGREVVAVDRDPTHARISKLNAEANGVGSSVRVVCADVRDLQLDDLRGVFIDPARRTTDRRLAGGTSEPPLSWCVSLAEGGRAVGIKASPGLPTDLIPTSWEAEFVSERRELKECALWSPALMTTRRRATVLPQGDTLVDADVSELEIKAPGKFLIDPDPAITRAGLVKELGSSLGECWQMDEQVAFLSSDRPIRTPFGRLLEIAESAPWGLGRLREALRALNVGVVDIRKRGSAVDVDELQRRLKLVGQRAATVVLTRVANKPWMFVCFESDATGLDLNR